ncbi:MAG: error-prone DNA polymerase [Pseudohongiellaceae bacterium]
MRQNDPKDDFYAELHCVSNFTFLRGASFPEELVKTADSSGYTAIAIADECSLSGVVRAHRVVRELSVKLIIGSEFTLAFDSFDLAGDGTVSDSKLVLLATDRKAYGQLSHLITCARREAKKGEYYLTRTMVEGNLPEDCIALWIPGAALLHHAFSRAEGGDSVNEAGKVLNDELHWLNKTFPRKRWIGVELLLRGDDRLKLQRLRKLGRRFGIPLCAAGGVYMHAPERRPLQDTVTAIRLGRRLDRLGYEGECNGQRHLRSREQLAKLYPPELLEATIEIAGHCTFSLDELRYEYPEELVPQGYTPHGWLRELTEKGIHRRWPQGASPKARNIIEHELTLIRELRYEHYFLTVHDLVAFARGRGILCQGRGSAANSVVCYCLGITEVNPDQIQVLFERFLSKERDEPPDIDVDFENARREEVIQYIYNKYGRGRAALAATVITYQSRSAVRDVGKALGLDEELIDRLAKSIFWWGSDLKEQLSDSDVDFADPAIHRLLVLCKALIGFPRHLSQHVGGFVISQGLLSHLVPIENAAMADRTVIQWEKDDLEFLGLLKIDVLALGMLTAVRKCLDLINSHADKETDNQLTVQKIPREDPKVYDLMCQADTVGIFQIESRAQMSMLPRLRPRCFYDLVIQIAIVRPGPIQGDMVHPYLARRSGKEQVTYPSEEVRGVLERTLGVPIFQEQVMQLAIVAAGFSGGEADRLRRSMAAWKKRGGLEPFRQRLVNGMAERGYEAAFAEQIFNQIKGFADYGFPESHSASFALIAYVSSWLKLYHPAAFCCALLNSQPMGFYQPAQLIQDVQRHAVTVLPVDVNCSDYDCSVEWDGSMGGKLAALGQPGLRIGFNQVKGLSEAAARAVSRERQQGYFASVQELVLRSGINKKDLEALAAADALRKISGNRYQAFWQTASKFNTDPDSLGFPQFDCDPDFSPLLPVPDEGQNVSADYRSTGFTLRRHPLALFREHLDKYKVSRATDLVALANESFAKVTGIVTCRQRPGTASGVTFLTLEDETGVVNVVVWPALGEKQRPVVRQAQLIGVSGKVQISEGVIHLIASRLVDLSHWLGNMTLRSRDFT